MEKVIDALIEKILEKMNDENSQMSTIKTVYFGEPPNVNDSNLPAIFLEPGPQTPEHQVSYDEMNTTIRIGILYPEKNEYGEQGIEGKRVSLSLKRKLIQLMQGQDENCRLLDDSIYGIIRDNPCLISNNKQLASDLNNEGIVYSADATNSTFVIYKVEMVVSCLIKYVWND